MVWAQSRPSLPPGLLSCLTLKIKPPRMNFLITFSHRRVIEYVDGVNSLNSSMSLWHHTVLQNCDRNFIFMRQLVTLITTCFLCQYNWKPMEQFHTFSQSFLCAATFQKKWGHSLTASHSFSELLRFPCLSFVCSSYFHQLCGFFTAFDKGEN